jgi:hypothetical protein
LPRLFLHIGTHKTGTTSLQRFLTDNRAVLRRQGLLYPDPATGGFGTRYAHHQVAHAIAGQPGAGTPDDARRFFDKVRRDLRRREAAVVSAEALYRHVLADPGSDRRFDAGGDAAGDPLPYIRRVRECLGDFDVTVLVMLRRQDTFLESLYAEQVMTSSYRKDIERFTTERAWLADYDARLSMWASVFGEDRLDVRTFEPASFPQGIERSFLEWVGGRWDDRLVPATVRNATVPRALVEYKRALNSRQSRAVSNTYRQWLEDLAAASPDGSLPDLGRYYFTHEARSALLEQFRDSNRQVAERYLGRSELFTDPAPTSPYPAPPRLSNLHFRRITRRLLRSLV